jgi:hypothetical protein
VRSLSNCICGLWTIVGCAGAWGWVRLWRRMRLRGFKMPFHKGWEKDAGVSTLPDGFSLHGKSKARRARSPTA